MLIKACFNKKDSLTNYGFSSLERLSWFIYTYFISFNEVHSTGIKLRLSIEAYYGILLVGEFVNLSSNAVFKLIYSLSNFISILTCFLIKSYKWEVFILNFAPQHHLNKESSININGYIFSSIFKISSTINFLIFKLHYSICSTFIASYQENCSKLGVKFIYLLLSDWSDIKER